MDSLESREPGEVARVTVSKESKIALNILKVVVVVCIVAAGFAAQMGALKLQDVVIFAAGVGLVLLLGTEKQTTIVTRTSILHQVRRMGWWSILVLPSERSIPTGSLKRVAEWQGDGYVLLIVQARHEPVLRVRLSQNEMAFRDSWRSAMPEKFVAAASDRALGVIDDKDDQRFDFETLKLKSIWPISLAFWAYRWQFLLFAAGAAIFIGITTVYSSLTVALFALPIPLLPVVFPILLLLWAAFTSARGEEETSVTLKERELEIDRHGDGLDERIAYEDIAKVDYVGTVLVIRRKAGGYQAFPVEFNPESRDILNAMAKALKRRQPKLFKR